MIANRIFVTQATAQRPDELHLAEAEMARRLEAMLTGYGAVGAEQAHEIFVDVRARHLTPHGLTAESFTLHTSGTLNIHLTQG